jgi:lantibiotic modifying enzyme
MSGSSRCIPNDDSSLKTVDAHQELVKSLSRIVQGQPAQPGTGLYAGSTSISYLFWRLSQIYPELHISNKRLKVWCLKYLELSKQSQGIGGKVDSAHCGVANEHLAQLALEAAISKDVALLHKLCSYSSAVTSTSDSGSDEWLYGRAGYLYFLRMVRASFKDDTDALTLIQNTIEVVAHRISTSPQPWVWHGKAYLGAAHGAIGILVQIVLSLPDSASDVQAMLVKLLDLQFPTGNFPSSLPVDSDRLVQFCHGAPGFVISLVSLRSHFPELQNKIDAAIEAGRKVTWGRGLLTKTPCLCHGIAGNALALVDGEAMEHFMSHMSSAALAKQDMLDEDEHRDDGLYTGEAGRAWAWAVVDKQLERTCIGFNDL